MALDEAAESLGITKGQVHTMLELVEEAGDILNRDAATDHDTRQIKARSRALAESGITHSAAYFSGTISRLTSQAQDAVASALNIGLGRIPGAPISVIVGSTVRISVTELLMVETKEESGERETRRKIPSRARP